VKTATEYSLVDAGAGRRLESFAGVVLDRPAAAATEPPREPEAWPGAAGRFDRDVGWRWIVREPEPWTIALEGRRFELRATESGQVGFFPEQASMWSWLGARVRREMQVLNLFGYTGGATLAAAASGASVVHVDASRTAVGWARRNAELSDLADRPIRWIVEDATAFVRRETRRGRRYEGIVLDPPSFGRSANGRSWRLEADLDSLLGSIVAVMAAEPAFILLTAHTPGFDATRLGQLLERHLGRACDAADLSVRAESGATLGLGSFARWSAT
jgi:23S rRNA (cytosine1962-C5)-methyltransferase